MADERKKSKRESCWDWIGSATFYIYLNFFLGAWGDRMWMFSVGMYLVTLAGGVLRLAAVYSLSGSCCFLLFGGILGDWVDKNGRLKVVRVTLIIQNLTIMLSAVAVALALFFTEEIYSSPVLKVVTEAAIIVFAVLAQLASMTYHIAIEKDWIVKVAKGDNSTLANLNAVIRSIDLSCKILAPIVCGFIMHYATMFISALVIVGWNIVSVFMEYGLLLKVYNMVPELAVKGKAPAQEDEKKEGNVDEKEQLTSESENKPESKPDDSETEETRLNGQPDGEVKEKSEQAEKKKASKGCVQLVVGLFVTQARSWKTYSKQSVTFAGLSLAFLYMTVLGFDSITVGFIYYNGVSEAVTGVSMAFAGLFGILGTFLYTRFRRRLGLEKTGLFSFAFEIICLVMCVISVFMPGTLFDPTFNPLAQNTSNCALANPTEAPLETVPLYDPSHPDNDTHTIVRRDIQEAYMTLNQRQFFTEESKMFNMFAAQQTNGFPTFRLLKTDNDFRSTGTNEDMKLSFLETPVLPKELMENTKPSHVVKKRHTGEQRVKREATEDPCKTPRKYDAFNFSVTLLLVGIVTSRIGLWMSDLVVTQTIQENVAEHERGTVNGIQGSLNMLMDILKNVLVILVPYIQTFGYLIILSFLFVSAGGGLFCFHAYKVRGHLCQSGGCCCCEDGDGGDDEKEKSQREPTENGIQARDEKKCVAIAEECCV